ncbi:MAG TPA: biotin/lipoyl-binding protein [Polyangiaceae bacterium]|nr:biotin/lipoyl-binding protein [Polyangiaceae bacterium]
MALAMLLAVFALSRRDRRPRSQDAFVYAYSTSVVPEVSGRITAVHVRENQRVAKDEILVEIEREPYELKLAQARAAVLALQAQIAVKSREVESQSSAAKAAETQIQAALSELDYAKSTTSRLSPLASKGYATPQQFDQARTQEKVAKSALKTAVEKAQAALQAVGDTESMLAQMRGDEAAMSLAEWNLSHTVLRAPFDGWVSGFDITEGAYASAGQPIFTLIKANEWYAVGNFRETELTNVQVGDPATVWLLGAKNQAVQGRVESIGWGVAPPNTGAPSLPQVGRTLNWVTIAQRFPVRIRLENVPEGVARLGETANILVAGDALAAEDAARESQLQKENARASVFTSAAALAFALGSATRR